MIIIVILLVILQIIKKIIVILLIILQIVTISSGDPWLLETGLAPHFWQKRAPEGSGCPQRWQKNPSSQKP